MMIGFRPINGVGVVGPLINGLYNWLVNEGDPNYLLGGGSSSSKFPGKFRIMNLLQGKFRGVGFGGSVDPCWVPFHAKSATKCWVLFGQGLRIGVFIICAMGSGLNSHDLFPYNRG